MREKRKKSIKENEKSIIENKKNKNCSWNGVGKKDKVTNGEEVKSKYKYVKEKEKKSVEQK